MRSCWPGLANWPVLYTSIHSLVLGPTLYTPLHSVGASTKPLVLASTLCLCGPYGRGKCPPRSREQGARGMEVSFPPQDSDYTILASDGRKDLVLPGRKKLRRTATLREAAMTYACIHSQHADYEYTLLNINMYYRRTLVIIVSKPAMIATANHGYFTADTDTSRSAHVTEPVAAPVEAKLSTGARW